MRLRRGLLIATLLSSLTQITLGGVVRITGSGDACPDWPTCFGEIVPEFSGYQVVLEWTHRTNGVFLGIIIIAAVVSVWVKRRSIIPPIFTSAALVMVIVVGLIGGAVVLSELNPAFRTLHLLLAEVTVLLLAVATVSEFNPEFKRAFKKPRRAVWLASVSVVMVLAIIVTGSYLVWKDWGAVCTGWPLCGEGVSLVPQNTAVWVNMTHRIVTLIAFIVAGYSVSKLLKWSKRGGPRAVALTALIVLVLEILIGATIPMSLRFWQEGYDLVRVAHLAVATVTWGALCVLLGFATLGSGLKEDRI